MKKADRDSFITLEFVNRISTLKRNGAIAHPELEKRLIKALLHYGATLPEGQRPASLEAFSKESDIKGSIDAFVEKNYAKSIFSNTEKYTEMLEKSPAKLMKVKDPFMEIAGDLWKQLVSYQDAEKKRQDALTILLPKMVDIRQMYQKSTFLPDANSTLRFTYGYIRGYSPADAEVHNPFTHVKGILEKASNSGDYYLEENIQKLL